METGILHLHGGLRYVVLLLMLLAIIRLAASLNKPMTESERKLAFWAMTITHIQLLLGVLLWILLGHYNSLSMMSNALLRFKALEHPVTMLIGITLITIGYSSAKRMKASGKGNPKKRMLIFYIVGLILILSRIPWPFLIEGGKWF